MAKAFVQPRSLFLLVASVVLSIVLTAQSPRPVQSARPASNAHDTLLVKTPTGFGVLSIYASSDWKKPQPQVTRVIVIFHGETGHAESSFGLAENAVQMAGKMGRGSIVIAPQFFAEKDALAHHLDESILRWHDGRWESGQNAAGPAGSGPAAVSSFDAIDAVLAQLADRSLFPNLLQIVLAGHGSAGEFLQRYAVVGREQAEVTKERIAVRYVISNPDSYVYFSEDRPTSTGDFAPYAESCKEFDQWKYGVNKPPLYVGKASFTDMEESYSSRDVIYLLGTADKDPHHPELDVSCAAETEGPNRLARGTAYFAYLKVRHPENFSQRLWKVPGIAHDEDAVFHSLCGMESLFDTPGCESAKVEN